MPSRLELRHRGRIYDFRQGRGLEVLFPRLFVGVVFARVLFKALQAPLLATIHIHKGIKELASLLAHVHHVGWWLPAYTSVKPTRSAMWMLLPKHFDDPGDLVVFTGTREEWKAKEKFNSDATEGPHIYRGGIRQAQ